MAEPVTAREVAAAWRPQRHGKVDVRRIRDAIVEPAWGGVRVVAALSEEEAAFLADGAEVPAPEPLLRATLEAFRGIEAVVEGHVTTEALRGGEGAFPAVPKVERFALLIPRIGRRMDADPRVTGSEHAADAIRAAPKTIAALEAGEPHAFVATDLLWLDGQSLLDVPLLERKRLLEATLVESELVRVTTFVQAAAVVTLSAWASLGFRDLAYKAANSRYHPGERNDEWAIGRAPSAPTPVRATQAPR